MAVNRRRLAGVIAGLIGVVFAAAWSHHGGDAGNAKYAADAQITPANVATLREAWRFSTGDLVNYPDLVRGWKFQATPILFEDRLIVCTPRNEVLALDPGTGAQIWRYTPAIKDEDYLPRDRVCRGVASWRDAQSQQGAPCSARVFATTVDLRLIALDARTGQACDGFAEGGGVRVKPEKPLLAANEMMFTSPPSIVGDVVLVGSSITDGARVDAPSGMVRAFDARTGQALWTFDPIPRQADDPRRATWGANSADVTGAANVWTPISADQARGVFYVATGSASPDYFGGARHGDNQDANSVVALDAETGRRLWAFQTVRHDVWDYDVSAPPTLARLTLSGATVDAVIQVTKMGFVFTLDRDTGAPLFAVEQRETPQGGVEGEALSARQPVPSKPQPLVPETVSAFGVTPWDRDVCARQIASLRHEGLFTPPSVQGTLVHPFSGGGANWGGAAFDPERQVLVVNTSDAAEFARLIPRTGQAAYVGQAFEQKGVAFTLDRGLVRSPLGLPCTDPPWGRLQAIDMKSGEILWTRPLGTFEDFAPFGDLMLPHGTPNLGGPIITASGLIFIGAAMDDYLRAFDVRSGAELWNGRLPAGGQATPMTYTWKGRQFVVIAAGGHGLMRTTPGDTIIAFALAPAALINPFQWLERPTPRAITILFAGVFAIGVIAFAVARARRRPKVQP